MRRYKWYPLLQTHCVYCFLLLLKMTLTLTYSDSLLACTVGLMIKTSLYLYIIHHSNSVFVAVYGSLCPLEMSLVEQLLSNNRASKRAAVPIINDQTEYCCSRSFKCSPQQLVMQSLNCWLCRIWSNFTTGPVQLKFSCSWAEPVLVSSQQALLHNCVLWPGKTRFSWSRSARWHKMTPRIYGNKMVSTLLTIYHFI